MYLDDFEAFYQQAEALYRSQPLKTRYCIKYRNCDGILVLKVTDDVKVNGAVHASQGGMRNFAGGLRLHMSGAA